MESKIVEEERTSTKRNNGDEEDVKVEVVVSALKMYDYDVDKKKEEEVSYLLLVMFDTYVHPIINHPSSLKHTTQHRTRVSHLQL